MTKELKSLVWKEWHEVEAYLWIGVGVFIGLPLIGGIEQYAQNGRFYFFSAPWVIILGSALAVFTAVGATCRDLRADLEGFWRSRPVSVSRWLLVKYIVGLVVVLCTCILPLAMEMVIGRETSMISALIALPFLWIAIYSIGFLAGCVIRRTAHAAMLALAVVLLLYFLPMILPPLRWLDITSITESNRYWFWDLSWDWDLFWRAIFSSRLLHLAGGMLGIAAIATLAAMLSVSREWRIESGMKLMYGSLAGAIFILFASTAFEMGTNLPILQEIKFPVQGVYSFLEFNGKHGFIDYRNSSYQRDMTINWYVERSIDLTPSGLQVGPPRRVNDAERWTELKDYWIANTLIQYRYGWGGRNWDHPEIMYNLEPGLLTIAETDIHYYLTTRERGRIVETIQLPWQYELQAAHRRHVTIFVWNKKLFIFGDRLLTLDISDPRSPRIVSDTPFDYVGRPPEFSGEEKISVSLPRLPDVPPIDRLRAVMPFGNDFDGVTLCSSDGRAVFEYRRTELTGSTATFEKVGQYHPSNIETLFGGYISRGMKMANGLLYVSMGYGSDTANPFITVLDTRDPNAMREVGHFAVPGRGLDLCPLPDGRAIVANERYQNNSPWLGQVWLIGPPPHRPEN